MFVSVIGLSATQREAARKNRLARGIFTPIEAAEFLGTTEGTLRWQRCKGKGPACHKDRGRFFYLKEDLEAYLSEKERASLVTTPARP
jgi:hypothetical protein